MFEGIKSKVNQYFDSISELNSKLSNIKSLNNTSGYNYNSGGDKYLNALDESMPMFFDRSNLVLRSREKKFYSTTFGSLIYWLTTYSIGTGLSLNANPIWDLLPVKDIVKQKKKKKQIEQYVKMIFSSDNLDYYAEDDTDKLFRDIFEQYLIDGDVFVLFSYHHGEDDFCPVKIRYIPTENIRNGSSVKNINNTFDGIEVDDNGKVVAYHMATKIIYDSSTFRYSSDFDTIRVPKYTNNDQIQVVHIKNKFSPNDLRGIPMATNILHELEKISQSIVAELSAMQMNAQTLGVIERDNPDVKKGRLSHVENALEQSFTDDDYGNTNRVETFNSPNLIFNGLSAGEKVKELSTNRPNLNLSSFVDTVVKPMVSSHGVPSEVLYGLFSNNYSASRAAIQQFWMSIKQYRKDFSRALLGPVYKAIISELVANKALNLTDFNKNEMSQRAWLNHNFIGSSQPSLDPNKDVEAASKAINLGITTRTKVAKELNGSNFDENIDELSNEEEIMKKLNVDLSLDENNGANKNVI